MSSVVSQAPRLTVSTAETVAEEKYGICGEFRRLPSERDQNFHIRSKDKHEYVLKIANQTEEKEALDFQNQAMIHVHHQKELFTDSPGQPVHYSHCHRCGSHFAVHDSTLVGCGTDSAAGIPEPGIVYFSPKLYQPGFR